MKKIKAEFKIIIAMLIFGSIGIFVKLINLPSVEVVLLRTVIGSTFIGSILLFTKQALDFKAIKQNLKVLLIAGVVLGGNWMFLFEAYQYSSVGIATLIHYSAPALVFILSPIVLKEKLTSQKVIGIMATIIGMLIINGINGSGQGISLGIIYGIISASLYACIMILNKFIEDLSGLETTFIQLFIAGIVMAVYTFVTMRSSFIIPRGSDLIMVVIVGVVHTGIACYLYFSSMRELPGQTIAIMSYIDPASTLIFSAIFLQERLTLFQVFGALLILGGTAFSQLYKQSSAKQETSKA